MPDEPSAASSSAEQEVRPVGVAESADSLPDEVERPPLPAHLLDPANVLGKESVLPGMDGLPFRGPIPDLRETDPDHMRPQVGYGAHVQLFVLSKPKDLAYYQQVIQLMANGFAVMGAEDRVYDKDIKSWRILLRWYEQFATMKPRGMVP